MSRDERRVPRFAELLVSSAVTDPIAREGLLGDLAEEYAATWAARSRWVARVRYWRAALGLALGYRRARGGHLRHHHRPPAPRQGSSLVQTFLRDLRFAARALCRTWGFTAVAIVTLAIGIGASTAMFATVNDVLVTPLPYPDPERLVLGRTTFDGRVNTTTSADDYEDYRARVEAFESLAVMFGSSFRVTAGGSVEAQRVAQQMVSSDLFRTLGVEPAIGRSFTLDEEGLDAAAVAIVSHAFWQQALSADDAALGATLVLDGTPYTVVGVMPAGFRFYHDVDVWTPYRFGAPFARGRQFHNWVPIGRLREGVAIAEAQAQVDVVAASLRAEYPETNRNKGMLLFALHEAMISSSRSSMLMLSAAVGLLLLIACANVANLLLARGTTRGAELAVRSALGAGRGRLVCQLMTESLVIAVLAGLLGAALSRLLSVGIAEVVPAPALGPLGGGSGPSMLAFALLASIGTSLVFGVVPALRTAPLELAGQLKGSARSGSGRGAGRLRSALVVAQVTLSVVLLIGAGLLVRSFLSLTAVDVGFDYDGLLAVEIRLPAGEYENDAQEIFFRRLLQEVGALPGVDRAGLINQLPIRDIGNNVGVSDAAAEPIDPGDAPLAFSRVVFPGYFETMGIPLLAGRAIEASDRPQAPPVVVINETMAARLFGEENPLGRLVRIAQNPEPYEVVGVVGDVLMDGPAYSPDLAFYRAYPQAPQRVMRLAIRSAADPASLAPSVRAAISSLDPSIPVESVDTMSSVIADSWSVRQSRLAARTLAVFAVVALLLAGVGLYGVLAQYVNQRSREIGVRMALGAQRGSVLRLVLGRGLLLVGIGMILGVGASVAGNQVLAQQLYAVSRTDPVTYLSAAAFFLITALVATLVPAWRAVRVDPLISLRAE